MKKRIMSYFVYLMTAGVALATVIMVLLTYSMFEARVVEDLSVDARVLSSLAGTENAETVYDSLKDSLRVTIISDRGDVLYDNAAAWRITLTDRRLCRRLKTARERTSVRARRLKGARFIMR